ncbi:DASS family sodium-coupled anion symporter [Corynebacterium glyciniphilum]|uniref:SLC13 family permease n=1 Tax=Corynebacterium glyciniphilum TaxID=1404244 RepID=UPI0026507698|nr:DASS family sodium-coupled anion symporter [Corynebacterium glyciniphilum]MDN5684664.1 DASS family sodium-coupled anion symporter [Corynebacterium glyciniphilum]MDN6704562.1 DASS family sodium-coupled anion symporter [Corynebacterium glyciniphilum]
MSAQSGEGGDPSGAVTESKAGDTPENNSPADEQRQAGDVERANNRKRFIGLGVGLVLAVIIYFIFPSSGADLVNEVHPEDENGPFSLSAMSVTAAVMVLMGAWWMTGALPLAATAMVPLVAFPILQVAPMGDVSAPYADPTIFLFMGGFVLALGIQRWGLHRRLALLVVYTVGTKPKQLVLGFMIATGFMSMWVSNTATAVVMLPIGVSVLTLTAERVGGWENQKKFATALMLAIAYSASIGSVGTLIGTPPNAFLAAYMSSTHGIEIGFGRWMMVGLPLAVVFTVVAWLVLVSVFKPEMDEIPGGKELIRKEIDDMGKITRPEVVAGIIFLCTAIAWITIPLLAEYVSWWSISIADAAIAMTAAVVMFIVPVHKRGTRVMDWEHAKELPWDVLILFGGGLSLSSMVTASGLSLWIGEMVKGMEVLPIVLLVFAIAAVVLALTEFTSNTATAATFIPIMGGVAIGIGLTGDGMMNIMLLIVPTALAASCAFMLPVATPPNAIAYGSGYVKAADMLKGGVWLNIVGVFLITLTVFALAVPVFGLTFG